MLSLVDIMVGNPYRWRATISQLENRHATAGCLLSLLFVVPYLAQANVVSPILLSLMVASYVTIIVPLLTGILSAQTFFHYARYTIITASEPEFWKDILRLIWFLLEWSHFLYLHLKAVHITTMQVVFNLAAEQVICPEERLCCLYVLLFYSVLAYLHRALQNRPWAQLLTERSTAELLKLTTGLMIIRLGKAMVMVMSVVLLTLSLQLSDMEPLVSYVPLTFSYFSLTQYQSSPFLVRFLREWLTQLQLQCLDGMEDLWVPFFLNCAVVGMAITIGGAVLTYTDSYFVLLIFSYTNIMVPTNQMLEATWAPLAAERRKMITFPMVSWKHPEIRSGGACAICLDRLRVLSARVTPCGHVFHGACIRQSLRYFSRCPLCKSPL